MRAVPFDLSRLEKTGEPFIFLEGVLRAPANQMGTAHFSLSETGSVAYLPGPVTIGGSANLVGIIDRSGNLKTLQFPPGAYTNPRFSTDGKQLAIGTDDGKEATYTSMTCPVINRCVSSLLREQIVSRLGTPHGQWIVFQSDRGGDCALWRQRANGTGIPERITTADDKSSHLPDSWLPGPGLKLSFTLETGGTDADLWIVNLEDKKRSPLVQDPRIQVRSTFSHDGLWFAYQTTSPAFTKSGRSLIR